MKIYADVLFAINFSMDFISLFITAVLLKRRVHKLKILISASLGGLYGVLSVIFPLGAVVSAILGVLVSFFMCVIAFMEKSIKRLAGIYLIYWGISAVLGGLMSVLYSFLNKLLAEYIESYSYTSVYTGARFFIVASLAILASIALSRVFSNEKAIKSVVVDIVLKDDSYRVDALCDSGNLLTEPISGKSVILVSADSKIGRKIEKIEDIYKRYIPYSSVGGEGMIKGVVPISISINGEERTAIVAPISNKSFAGYEACVPLSLV